MESMKLSEAELNVDALQRVLINDIVVRQPSRGFAGF